MTGMSRRRFFAQAGAGAVGGALAVTASASAAASSESEGIGALVSIVAASPELAGGRTDIGAATTEVLSRYAGLPGSTAAVVAALDEQTRPQPFARTSRAGQLRALQSAVSGPRGDTVACALTLVNSVVTGCDRAPLPRLTLAKGLYV
jgi:hypothetical protein